LDSEVMCIWIGKFNQIAKACADEQSRTRKKYTDEG
jgi:hypothetical protein